MRPSVLFASAVALAVLVAPIFYAQEYAADIPVKTPAIHWFDGPFDNPVSRLAEEIESGKVTLDFRSDGTGYLASVLNYLRIPIDSQALVFSKTSFQAPKISPKNPRAIYFGDNAAVGYVRDGDGLELAGTDSKQGVQFYTLTAEDGKPVMHHQDVCLKCHQGPATFGIPGVFIGSVFPGPTGVPDRVGAIITDHRTKFEDRWGGWYINAKSGEQPDRANSVASNPSEPEVLENEGQQNLTSLLGKFDPKGYLSPISDIVALMTFEHQTQMANYMTRAAWEARIAQHDGKTDDFTWATIDSEIESMVKYMLFVDEVPLKEPLVGVSTFTKTFPQHGPRDHQGRSLRDFDLQKRLFRYPLSYMIYSAQFDAMPDAVKQRVYQRLYDVLTGKDQREQYATLSAADRSAILEILRDTKPDLPSYWRAQITAQ